MILQLFWAFFLMPLMHPIQNPNLISITLLILPSIIIILHWHIFSIISDFRMVGQTQILVNSWCRFFTDVNQDGYHYYDEAAGNDAGGVADHFWKIFDQER